MKVIDKERCLLLAKKRFALFDQGYWSMKQPYDPTPIQAIICQLYRDKGLKIMQNSKSFL